MSFADIKESAYMALDTVRANKLRSALTILGVSVGLLIAMGSASELEYHLLLARDLGFLPEEDYGRLDALTTEVKRMRASLIQKTRQRTAVG